jgi:nucleoside-diphosphate-sugar epimerase
MKQDRTVLLIGGAGYIGSVLAGHLLEKGCRVRCLDLLLYRNGRSLDAYRKNDRFDFMLGDMGDPAALSRALDGVTDVVLLAGLVGDPITKKYPEWNDRVNVRGVRTAIEAFGGLGIERVVFVSTCSNYGLIPQGALADENYALTPLSLYAKAKVAAEVELLAKKDKVDYCATALRFATAFGLSPRMRFDLTVSEFTRELSAGRELLVYDADTWRPYCHVGDFCRIIETVLEAPREKVYFETFNAGGEKNNFTKRMIVETVLKHVPGGRVAYKEHGSDPRNYKVNFGKIRSRLGFESVWSVEDGVRELVEALKKGRFSDYDKERDFYGNYAIEAAEVKVA